MEASEMIIVLIGSCITLMGWSMLYRENWFFRWIEHLTIGLMTGYTFYTALKLLIDSIFVPLIYEGAWVNIIPIIFGLLLLTRVSSEYRWLSRWGIAALAGIGSGLAVKRVIPTMISRQLLATAKPLAAGEALMNFNNVLILIGTITVISYFLFTLKPGGFGESIISPLAKIGRLFLMATFGAIIGADILCNGAFLLERMSFLTGPVAWYPIPIALILIAIDALRSKTHERE